MKSKGQTLVFEQVLLFGLGIVILITSFALFIMYQSFYVSETTQDQLTQVKEYILSNIIKLAEQNELESQIVISVPRTIGNSYYRISLSDIGLNITLEPEGKEGEFTRLFGLNETFSFGGMVISDAGEIVIYKRGDSIIIQ